MSNFFEKVIGVDISDAQLEAAKDKFSQNSKVTFQNCDVKNLPTFLEKENIRGKVDMFCMG